MTEPHSVDVYNYFCAFLTSQMPSKILHSVLESFSKKKIVRRIGISVTHQRAKDGEKTMNLYSISRLGC